MIPDLRVRQRTEAAAESPYPRIFNASIFRARASKRVDGGDYRSPPLFEIATPTVCWYRAQFLPGVNDRSLTIAQDCTHVKTLRCLVLSLASVVAGSLAASLAHAQPAVDAANSGAPHGIEAYIGENAMQALYTRRMNIGEVGMADLHAGVFFNEDRDLVGIGDLLAEVADTDRFPRWSFQVGPRTYAVLLSAENQDIFGIGLGGRARYALGSKQSVSIQLIGFYAPDILTFGEADDMTEVTARLELALMSNWTGFIGYRVFDVGLLDGDKRLDDGVHLGVRRTF